MTKNILHIISSPRGERSFSTCLSNAIIQKITDADSEEILITERDLTINQPAMLSASQITAFYKDGALRTDVERRSLLYSDMVINEVQNADIIVIGIAMHNLAIPAVLRAWIDQIVRIGVSFKWGGDGKKIGLFSNKQIYLAIASGRIHSTANYKTEFIESYLKIVFRSIGITGITTYRVEGTAKTTIEEINFSEIVSDLQEEIN